MTFQLSEIYTEAPPPRVEEFNLNYYSNKCMQGDIAWGHIVKGIYFNALPHYI